MFTDVNGDGRLDLYVANDANPNRLYLNVPWPGGAKPIRWVSASASRSEPASAGVADPNAGMGIAAADYSGDGRPDLLVTNSHKQLHGVFRSEPAERRHAVVHATRGRTSRRRSTRASPAGARRGSTSTTTATSTSCSRTAPSP